MSNSPRALFNGLDMTTPLWPPFNNCITPRAAFALGVQYVREYLLSISRKPKLGYNGPALSHFYVQTLVLKIPRLRILGVDSSVAEAACVQIFPGWRGCDVTGAVYRRVRV
ncbi:hypothetical protein PtrCC142_007281 [Pyrenophora tritici-repentis]|uniref:Uncharacterized protein n=2 Tax=Pyrenophora tritici-repentis TaxID=45151 RepID=A0A2W1DSK0_9PLEO|nr:uncharacterized protein PTRG_03149 [Pyrenophora tritici-repentis Pt-1C-BFP]KAF7575132.1 hypothetical protein PtrM4_067560 [Pyrenophora tritici-repentis]EDU45672.1 predicted protein [Pyrenophora tritici-repentis Pt-1C-BFP]KAI1515115.1 hypothetical protein Ptr86124_006438 [Pyrenophora tritici-repentis]KAI1599647.1 hypothetical protein PtrCC142_007281 [Pyrenophora tritici-repentis]KAI1672716.1 hypothetical protein L13192_03575 [Pyrenophora tritici-repentis]